jgi:hypothetical protein
MFVIYCPHHRARVLLSPDNIEAIVNTCTAMELHWRCSCGETGVEHVGQAVALSVGAA